MADLIETISSAASAASSSIIGAATNAATSAISDATSGLSGLASNAISGAQNAANGLLPTSSAADPTLTRTTYIPTNIISQNLMSPTSRAYLCYSQQFFSNKLQAFLINYVISVTSNYSIYK